MRLHKGKMRVGNGFILVPLKMTFYCVTKRLLLPLYYCKKLHMHDKKNRSTKTIDYPVIADYFIDSQWLLVRAKPRSNLYIFNPDGFNLEDATTTTTEKEIRQVTILVEEILKTEKTNKTYVSSIHRNPQRKREIL